MRIAYRWLRIAFAGLIARRGLLVRSEPRIPNECQCSGTRRASRAVKVTGTPDVLTVKALPGAPNVLTLPTCRGGSRSYARLWATQRPQRE